MKSSQLVASNVSLYSPHPHRHLRVRPKVNDKKAKVGASVFGQTVKLALSNWETWMIYTSESVTWKLSSGNEVKVCPRSVVVPVAVSFSRAYKTVFEFRF